MGNNLEDSLRDYLDGDKENIKIINLTEKDKEVLRYFSEKTMKCPYLEPIFYNEVDEKGNDLLRSFIPCCKYLSENYLGKECICNVLDKEEQCKFQYQDINN